MMLLFGFQMKHSHASHTLLNLKKKILLAILFAFWLQFFAARPQKFVPQLTTRLKIWPAG